MRRARLESRVDDPDAVAGALHPDDTTEIETRVVDGTLVAEIERPETRSLQSTVDDYLVNLGVAIEVIEGTERTGRTNDTQTKPQDTHDT